MPSLRFTLSTGKDFSKTLPDDRSIADELNDFERGIGNYQGSWVSVDKDVLISREAIVAVSITRESSY